MTERRLLEPAEKDALFVALYEWRLAVLRRHALKREAERELGCRHLIMTNGPIGHPYHREGWN